jgi:probable HAF family extracellular repeat protein
VSGLAELASLSGGRTRATDINNAGQVAGWSDAEPGVFRAFITGLKGGGMRYIGGNFSQAGGLNEAGQVVGTEGDLGSRAFITGPNGESQRFLGTLGRPSWAWAGAINEAGQVLGQVLGDFTTGSYEAPRPFITGPDGVGMRDLSSLGGGRLFSASSINDIGQVAASSSTVTGVEAHAVVTGPNGEGLMDLNSLIDVPDGVVLTEAVGINNMGQVVAVAQVIPEPESYVMLIVGLGLIGVMARRKRLLA